jgi:RimJ/RimL family protein N-acetyltransferase
LSQDKVKLVPADFGSDDEGVLEGYEPRDILRYTIQVDGRTVGECSYDFGDQLDAGINVGILEPEWGRGYGAAAVANLICRLRDQHPALTIRACCLASNGRSRRLLERAGLKFQRKAIMEIIGTSTLTEVLLFELLPATPVQSDLRR